MAIYLIDKIKQKNDGDFKLVDASDINWDIDIPADNIPDTYYTKEETDSKISSAIAASGHLKRVVLGDSTSLPDTGDTNTIYMVPREGSSGQDVYDEYMYINSVWEKIGNSQVDLSDYATTEAMQTYVTGQISTALGDAGDLDATVLASAKEYSDSQSDAALASAKAYTDQEKAKYLPLAGGTMIGKITGIVTPTNATDAANKEYVDSMAAGVTPENMLTPTDITTGSANGSFAVKGTDVFIKGLGTAAYMDSDDLLSTDDLVWNPITQ